MNLQKLFEAQAVLDADIEKHHPVQDGEDRLSKKILALLVELGECANEWRGFKFWSSYQGETVNDAVCEACNGEGFFDYFNPVDGHSTEDCENCDGTGLNPLLLEYVDCLHFALDIWNENPPCTTNEMQAIMKGVLEKEEAKNPMYVFLDLFNELSFYDKDNRGVIGVLKKLAELSKALNFTWNQIEQAYFVKNKINHQRQAAGY